MDKVNKGFFLKRQKQAHRQIKPKRLRKPNKSKIFHISSHEVIYSKSEAINFKF